MNVQLSRSCVQSTLTFDFHALRKTDRLNLGRHKIGNVLQALIHVYMAAQRSSFTTILRKDSSNKEQCGRRAIIRFLDFQTSTTEMFHRPGPRPAACALTLRPEQAGACLNPGNP